MCPVFLLSSSVKVSSLCDKYTHLQINVVFTGDSSESLVYGVLQLNVLCTLESPAEFHTDPALSLSVGCCSGRKVYLTQDWPGIRTPAGPASSPDLIGRKSGPNSQS
ncbi:hypothetical protein CSKR_111581 [Clonorchis sinensis]|uniref:Uncharacterized protein n=1 Tax=Clonorchis sinensis TaxID=79923 RepID=A0A419PI53_CLOSI|nr:hypothetical protein CSKR_111581 [Clonorchis sinensis]